MNMGVVSGTTGNCGCDCSTTGYGGPGCDVATPCVASNTRMGEDVNPLYCVNGTVSGMSGNCVCTCDPGFYGTACQLKDSCTASSDPSDDGTNGKIYCMNSGFVSGTTGNCGCDCSGTGFGGPGCDVGTTCVASNAVMGNNVNPFYCLNGTVSGMSGNCVCTCDLGFNGLYCQFKDPCTISSDPSDDGSNGLMYCYSPFNTPFVSGYTGACDCLCETGWSGPHCDIPDACVADLDISDGFTSSGIYGSYLCLNGGTISGTSGNCACACAPGFTGNFCHEMPCIATSDVADIYGTNEKLYCINNGSIHGTFNSVTEIDNCACLDCSPGYNGVNCEHEIDECLGHQCANGATCLDGINSYSCDCSTAPGWTGTMCTENIDDCGGHSCVNGVCVDGNNGYYTCACTGGYEGRFCQHEINDCDPNPCVHGTCTDKINNYTCACTGKYTGKNCDLLGTIETFEPWYNWTWVIYLFVALLVLYFGIYGTKSFTVDEKISRFWVAERKKRKRENNKKKGELRYILTNP